MVARKQNVAIEVERKEVLRCQAPRLHAKPDSESEGGFMISQIGNLMRFWPPNSNLIVVDPDGVT